jgi:hypothetical protein
MLKRQGRDCSVFKANDRRLELFDFAADPHPLDPFSGSREKGMGVEGNLTLPYFEPFHPILRLFTWSGNSP